MFVLHGINHSLGFPRLGHFQESPAAIEDLHLELSGFIEGKSIQATISMGDSGFSRLYIRWDSDPYGSPVMNLQLPPGLIPSSYRILVLERWLELGGSLPYPSISLETRQMLQSYQETPFPLWLGLASSEQQASILNDFRVRIMQRLHNGEDPSFHLREYTRYRMIRELGSQQRSVVANIWSLTEVPTSPARKPTEDKFARHTNIASRVELPENQTSAILHAILKKNNSNSSS